MMKITELPPFNPRLEDYRAEEFLAHTLMLLEYPIEQDQVGLDNAPFEVQSPPPPPDPLIPLLPHIWYPKATQAILQATPKLVEPARPQQFIGDTALKSAEQIMRPLLSGQGPIVVKGESGVGKTTMLRYIATHERTRQRFRRIWYMDDPERIGQIGAILLHHTHILGEPDPYRQLALLQNELDDDTLLVIDNLTEDHHLWLACQTLSPFTLLAVHSDPEVIEPDENGEIVYPPDNPGTVTLRRLPPDEAVYWLAEFAELMDRKNLIPRDVRPRLVQLANVVDCHPLSLVILSSIMIEDDVPPEFLVEHCQNLITGAGIPPGPDVALRVCIDSLAGEYRKLVDAFAGFSPLGVNAVALQHITKLRNDLTFRHCLTILKRHHLIEADPRYPDRFIPAGLLYQRVTADRPHEPGKRQGERARDWILSFVDDHTYQHDQLFIHEHHIRYALNVAAQYQLNDFSVKLSRSLSDYLRTYIAHMLPLDAPPPRLMGDRAEAVKLARQGLQSADSRDFTTARDILNEALAAIRVHGSEHEIAETLVMLARVEDATGNVPLAIEILEDAARIAYDLNAAESLSVIRLGLAMAYRHNGRLKDALGVLDDRPEANGERARIYRAMGDLDNMIQALSTSGDMTPYERAESYLQAYRYADALEAIAEDNSPQSHYIRALIYHLQEEYDAAIKGYRRAVQIYTHDDPERAIPIRAISAIHALRDEYNEAEELLTQTANNLQSLKTPQADLQYGLTLGLLAAVHLKRGNNRTAVETANQALSKLNHTDRHHDMSMINLVLARANWRLDRYDDALKAFNKQTEHVQSERQRDETRIGIAFFHVGQAYRMTGKLDRAVANYRRALTHLDADVTPHVYFIVQSGLHRALYESDRHPDAMTLLDEILEHLDGHPPPDLQFLGYIFSAEGTCL